MAKGLGRGLDALFPGESLSDQEKIEQIHVKSIKPNPYQPRKIFSKEAIEELSGSIKEHGILQPIIVRKKERLMKLSQGNEEFVLRNQLGLTKFLLLFVS